MCKTTDNLFSYYSSHGLVTDPGDQAALFEGLPSGVPELCRVVQGLMVHIFWAERYGLQLSEERKGEVQLRATARQVARICELHPGPLTAPRPLEHKLVGNCRDFAVLLCALLRSQGVPARARCGFGTYFTPGRYEDHWVCEYWDAARQRWALVDAQLDEVQRDVLRIDFDMFDVPRDRFVTGGKAWQLCRSGQVDPDLFGIFDMHGLWFVRGNLVRDFLALNKVEILPWDGWGLMAEFESGRPVDSADTPEIMATLDRMAELTLAGNEAFGDLRALFENDGRLRAPGWRP